MQQAEKDSSRFLLWMCEHVAWQDSMNYICLSWERRKLWGTEELKKKRLETVEREVKDSGFLGRTLQTSSFQKHLSIRSSKLVLGNSITVFHLCFCNNTKTNTEFPNVSVLCCLPSDRASCSITKMEGKMKLERISSSSVFRQIIFQFRTAKKITMNLCQKFTKAYGIWGMALSFLLIKSMLLW